MPVRTEQLQMWGEGSNPEATEDADIGFTLEAACEGQRNSSKQPRDYVPECSSWRGEI